MQMMRKVNFTTICLFLLATLASCIYDHEECTPTPSDKLVRFRVDWSKFDKEVPSGMTVTVFSKESISSKSVLTNDISHADFLLTPSHYNAFVFNQSTTEFGTLEFYDMDSFDAAKAVVAEKTSKWFVRADRERLAVEPEWLAVGQVVDVEVSDEDTTLVEMEAHNTISTVTVIVRVPGIHNLRSVRGSLSGIADGYLIGQDKATTDTITYLLEKWTKEVDKDDATKGTLTATFRCFGLPDGHLNEAVSNRLDISVLLVDNKTQLDYTFAVGDRFKKSEEQQEGETSGNVNLQLSLDVKVEIPDPLPDVKPVDGSDGSFEVEIEDWGKPEDVNMNI